MSSSPLPEYSALARTSERYASSQNGTKRRRIENRNAFDILSDDNINPLSSSPDPLHGSTTIHNRILQDVTHDAINRSLPKGNRRRRVAGSKNQPSLPPPGMWFHVVYADANVVEIEPKRSKKPTNRGRPAGSKNKAPMRSLRQPRAGRHALPPFSPPVMQPSRRSRRIEEVRVAREEVLPELRAQALLEDEEEEELPEHAARAMDDNGFMDLDQLLASPSPMPSVRNRTTHRDGKSLGSKHMAARMPENRPEEYVLPRLHTPENRCPHCSAYQYDEECHEKAGRSKYWHCCFDGKVPDELPTAGSDSANIEKLPDGEEKNRLRAVEAKIQRELHSLLYNMEPDPDNPGQQRRTEASKKFQKLIVTYNNVLSFCSEAAIVDKKNSTFSTFRAMGGVKHLLGAMLAEKGDVERFCQIYQIDSSQDTTERRLELGEDLEQEELLLLTRLMRDVNPYAQAYKTCGDRLRDEPNPQARFALKQNEPERANQGTHNKPTSDEVAALIVMPETLDSNHVLERDIIIQEQGGGLRSVPYWHAAYMPLRYPILFPHGEQSWNVKVPLRGFEASKKLFARRAASGRLLRHNVFFDNEDQIDPGEPEQELDPLRDEVAAEPDAEDEDDHVPAGRGGSKRTTQKQFYAYMLQVSFLLESEYRFPI